MAMTAAHASGYIKPRATQSANPATRMERTILAALRTRASSRNAALSGGGTSAAWLRLATDWMPTLLPLLAPHVARGTESALFISDIFGGFECKSRFVIECFPTFLGAILEVLHDWNVDVRPSAIPHLEHLRG